VVPELRRDSPDGVPFEPDAFVFGNEVGEQVHSTKKA
jgi:hypothetical protein